MYIYIYMFMYEACAVYWERTGGGYAPLSFVVNGKFTGYVQL